MNKFMRLLPRILIYILVLFVAVITLFPLFSTIMASFKSNMEIMIKPETILPEVWTFDNYVQAFNSSKFNLGRMLFNSMWTSIIEVAIEAMKACLSGEVPEKPQNDSENAE